MRDWFRNVRYGLRNLWAFLPVVWKWRGWDYEYTYRLFLRGLELQSKHICECRNHVGWREDVLSIEIARELWRDYMDPSETVEEEEESWDVFHDHLKAEARKWWD